MITGLGGIQWAGTLLACVALALVPLPVLFYLKGAKIREKSKFAPTFSQSNKDDHVEDQESDDLEAGKTDGEPNEK